ncbi:MAG: dihydrolipoamide acetyltransferase family protein [Thermoplasmata archaeon]
MVDFFRLPDLGEGVTEGTIIELTVEEGDVVEEDEDIGKVETDKALVDISSPYSGTVLKVPVAEGDEVKVGEVIIVVGEKGEEIPDEEMEKKEPEKIEEPAKPKPKEEEKGEGIKATPRVRKLAEEKGIDLSEVEGTGSGGRITEEDLEKEEKEGKEEKPPRIRLKHDFYGDIEHIEYKGIRKTIGDKMSGSKFSAPHAASMDEADVTELWDLRKELKEESESGLSFLPLVTKAAIEALKENPLLNAELVEEHEDIIVKKYYNIGIAVATDNGLMVPVVKRAELKDVFELYEDIVELAEKAKDRTIDLAELKGSTFTITNYGSIGGTYGVPIINPPNVAVLGTGKIRDLPRVVDGEIVPRKIMQLSVAFDHRVVDGAEVAGFMNSVIDYLENPEKIPLEGSKD